MKKKKKLTFLYSIPYKQSSNNECFEGQEISHLPMKFSYHLSVIDFQKHYF